MSIPVQNTDALNTVARVLIDAGPAPTDYTHPYNVALSQICQSMAAPCGFRAFRSEELPTMCAMLCAAVRMSRDATYCRLYATALALLCTGLDVPPLPIEGNGWLRLLARGAP